jgi:hypothetical protein
MTARPEIGYAFFCGHLHGEGISGKVSALGLWGDECKFTNGPPTAVDLAVLFYVRNPVKGVPARIEIQIPGAPMMPAGEVPVATLTADGSVPTGAHLMFNLPTVPIVEAGDVIVRLRMDGTPPLKHEIRLRMTFPEAPSSRRSRTRSRPKR